MDPDHTARMRRLVWIHAGRKPIMLFFSCHGSQKYCFKAEYKKSTMLASAGNVPMKDYVLI
jgi:hypothetical protein